MPLIFFGFLLPGLVYGLATGSLRSDKDVATTFGETMAGMGSYIVLAFFAAQFIAYFAHSGLGEMLAISGGRVLARAGLPDALLMIGFIGVVIVGNLFIGSMSAKYAFFAPVFVPMFMQVGISPELTQVAYRVGDSVSNVITPLNPYVVILLVLIVLMVVGPSLMEMSKNDVKVVQQEETLTLSYERVQGTPENIFRYHLQLDNKGVFSVKIDDLKANRHQIESRKIPDTLLAQLSHSIEAAGFFEVDSDYAGTSASQYDLYDIAVQRNRRFHHIRVLNWTPPTAIKRTTQVIEDFAISELGISFTWVKDPEELMQLAITAFEIGKARYEERDVRYENIAQAISQFKEAKLYLETIEPKPGLFKRAEKALETALNEQEGRYEHYMFLADRATRLKNWDDAAKYLRILSEVVQDRSDPRYDKISAKLLNVEQHLK